MSVFVVGIPHQFTIMERKENRWFNDIPCPGKTTYSDGIDYLDRLIGGGGQKQFLVSNRKEPAKNNRQQKQYSNIKPSKPRQVKVEVDDIKWIEERKKKFPKVSGSDSSETPKLLSPRISAPKLDQPCDNASTTNDPIPKPAKSSMRSNFSQRRRSLFQKLMEMETS